MIIAQVCLRLATIKGHYKMCSFIAQHNATDVASFEGACNWQANCKNAHLSGPTLHRPQSTTWSTLCEGDVLHCVRKMVVTPDTDWFSDFSTTEKKKYMNGRVWNIENRLNGYLEVVSKHQLAFIVSSKKITWHGLKNILRLYRTWSDMWF